MIHTEDVPYRCGNEAMKGVVAFDPANQAKRPAVIIASDWKGIGDFSKDKAETLAKYGYLSFVADIYGHGKHADTEGEAADLMKPLFIDRKLLRERIVAAYDKVKSMPICDQSRISAIGFCFGGLTVIELLRSGAALRGVVTFHGIYGDTLGDIKAVKAPNGAKMRGSALLLQGYEDPLLPPGDIANFQKELNDAGIDWQMHTFGHTAHAFTNPLAANPDKGLIFNPASSRRAWQMMHLFLEEHFV
jgi:dienelactone hydrolase